MHVWYFGLRGAFWRNCRQNIRKTPFFLVFGFFFVVDTRPFGGEVCLFWHLWIGRARHPGPDTASFAVEVFNVGGWLTHGDLALEAGVDFLAVVEHTLIPARVRSEWARLRSKGLASVWAPASQGTSHVGHAGVGVVSLEGAPLSLPSFGYCAV